LSIFESSQPIAVAVTSGAIRFRVTGFTGRLLQPRRPGVLKIISGGYAREAPGFHNQGYVASNQAYAGGLKSLKIFPAIPLPFPDRLTPHYALECSSKNTASMRKRSPLALQREQYEFCGQRRAGRRRDHDRGRDIAARATRRRETPRWSAMRRRGSLARSSPRPRANDHRDTVERFLRALAQGRP